MISVGFNKMPNHMSYLHFTFQLQLSHITEYRQMNNTVYTNPQTYHDYCIYNYNSIFSWLVFHMTIVKVSIFTTG